MLSVNQSIFNMADHFILSKEIAYQKIHRMAYEIVEQNVNEKQIILAGIKENGSVIATALYQVLKEIFKEFLEKNNFEIIDLRRIYFICLTNKV